MFELSANLQAARRVTGQVDVFNPQIRQVLLLGKKNGLTLAPRWFFFFRLISSAKPEAKMPAGKATMPIPRRAMIEPNNLPTAVTGRRSPYPTVVSVAIAHHMVAGILEKMFG